MDMVVVGGIFFSLLFDIDGQSLRRGVLPSIDGYFYLWKSIEYTKA